LQKKTFRKKRKTRSPYQHLQATFINFIEKSNEEKKISVRTQNALPLVLVPPSEVSKRHIGACSEKVLAFQPFCKTLLKSG